MISNKIINILLIEDEDFDVRRVHNTLKPFEDQLIIRDVVSEGMAALDLIENNRKRYDIIIMDFQIAGSLTGESLIRRIKAIDETIQIIVITKMTVNITDFDFANKLLEAGAVWYCTKYPGDIEDYIYQPTDFILSIYNAYERRKLKREQVRSTRKLTQKIEDILEEKRIIGESEAMINLRTQISQCAGTDVTALIRGASGTGKELVAANIHYLSDRKFEKFIAINCGSLPHDLIESELFGYEKGAFTGAQDQKLGLFEIANKGTIFLDEIAELPLSAQVKLLRVIQEGEIDKIGRTEKIKVNVRIIAATNKNLEQEVREKRFREDLYYRVNVVSIWTHPLNNLRKDVPLLVAHYLQKLSAEMGQEIPELSVDSMQMLINYDWPGNIRELQNVIQRLLFVGDKNLQVSHIKNALGMLSPSLSNDSPTGLECWTPDDIRPLRDMEREFRERYFRFVRDNSDSDAEAARLLGLAPPNYHRMCKELGLK